MNKLTRIGLLISCTLVTGCGGSGEEALPEELSDARMSVDAARKSADALRNSVDSMSEPDIELGGQFEISAPAPFGYSSSEANLRCQDAFPGSPFHAIWTVAEPRIGIKVSGFRDSNGSPMHKIDTFNISVLEDNRQKEARLSGATLSTVPIGSSGAVTYYEVEATGRFEDGGTFKASGTCRA